MGYNLLAMSHYCSYNDFLQKKFGCRVYKVSIDAGFTCPNRDGSKGLHGCIFCDERGSSSRTHAPSVSVANQIINNINIRRNRYGAKKFIAYFQSFTNTYAPLADLKKVYDEAINAHPDIVGLAVSTRADCGRSREAGADRLLSHQSALCLRRIRAAEHSRSNIEAHQSPGDACGFCKSNPPDAGEGLDHCAHVILGLPNETHQDMIETAKQIAGYQIQGVKIHFLVAMPHTQLARQYAEGKWRPLAMEEAVLLTCDFLEHLPPDCIIYRIGGNGHPRHAIAPEWVWKRKKSSAIASIGNSSAVRHGRDQNS